MVVTAKSLGIALQAGSSVPLASRRPMLTTGIVDAAMHSHHEGGKPIDTPHLTFSYTTRDYSRFRENGSSWKVLTRDTPEPVEFTPGDA